MRIKRICFLGFCLNNKYSSAVFNDVIGNIQRLDLGFVAVEELLAYLVRTIGAGRVGYPRQIGVRQQIDIHRVLPDRLFKPNRHFPKRIIEPHFRYDQLGVEEDRLRLTAYRPSFGLTDRFAVRLDLLYLIAGDLAELIERDLGRPFLLHVRTRVLRHVRSFISFREIAG